MAWKLSFFKRLSEGPCKDIFFNFYRKTYIYVQLLFLGANDADSITLNTLLRVCSLGKGCDEEALLSLVRRIATDECLDHLKRDPRLRWYYEEYLANNKQGAGRLDALFDNALRLERKQREWNLLSPAEQEEIILDCTPFTDNVRHYSWPYIPSGDLERTLTNTGEEEQNRKPSFASTQSQHFATAEKIVRKLMDLSDVDPASQWERFKKQLEAKQRKIYLSMVAAASVVAIVSAVVFYKFRPGSFSAASSIVSFINKGVPVGNEPEFILHNGTVIKLDSVSEGAFIAPGVPFKKKESTLVYTPLPNDQAQDQGINVLSVSPRRHYQITLADSSVIDLNASSQLYFPVNFSGNERWVGMKGEAYFEVESNVARPFMVSLKDDVFVKVTGTSFNINAYNGNDYINTTLLKGRLEITANRNRESQLLLPGQQTSYKKGGFVLKDSLNIEQVTAWKEGVFYFHKKTVKDIMNEFGQWFNVKIMYKGTMPEKPLTARLPRSTSLSSIIALISQAKGIDIKMTGDTLIVSSEQ